MKNLSHSKLREIALLCGGVAFLVAFALVLSGHAPFVPRALSMFVHQNVQSQTAAVWASYYPAYDSGWPVPHVPGSYGQQLAGWCNTRYSVCPLPSYASVYVNSNPGNIQIAKVVLPGYYGGFQPYQGPTYAGSAPTVAAGTPVTIEWACQDWQSVTIVGGQCQSFDAFGNCSNYSGGGGYVNSVYDYGPAILNGASTGSNVGATTVYPTQTTTYSVYCPASGWQMQTTVHPSIPTSPTMYLTVNVTAPPYPTQTITATPASINSGDASTINVSESQGANVDACKISGGPWNDVPVGPSGHFGTGALYTDTQYSYTCHDVFYGWIPRVYTTVSVAASVVPVQADFAPVSPTVMVGQSATLLYYANSPSDPPTQCEINGANNIPVLVNVSSCTIAQNKSYTTPVYTTPGTYDYYFYYYRRGWTYVKPAYVTVVAACPNGSGAAGSCTACNSGYALSGGNCVLTATDICTDINGTQVTTPTGCQVPVPNPGSCIPSGYTYNGTQCVAPPSISTFSASPVRVHKNTPTNVTFSYLVTNPGSSCTISGPSGFTPLTINPTSAVVGTRIASVVLPQASYFTLTCGAASAQTRVNLIPVTQEL